MKKQFILSLNLIILVFLVSQVFSQNGAETKANPITKSAPATTEKIERDFAEALTLIEENYIDGKKVNYNELFKSSIDSMLHTLDPHSNYYDAKETEQFRTDQSSQYFGIGVSIGEWREGAAKVITTRIRATFENSPANRAGLRYGDKVVEVNGVSMIGKPSAEISTNLRGARGTVAKVTVEHFGTRKRETVELIRDAVPQPSIPEAYMIRPSVGYIGMTVGFHRTTYNEFVQALDELKSQGMKSLVLDLRDNGGGLVVEAYKVANAFLSNGQTVFKQIGRQEGANVLYAAENNNPDKTPIVVLVNNQTASASEILAGALQDHDRALVLGETTFGKGLVQNPFGLEYGSMLLLTIAKYYTPSGRLIQREYSELGFYDYYYKGGSLRDDAKVQTSIGEANKTDTGRIVYGGVGIIPDEIVKASTIPTARFVQQLKLADSVFDYAINLAFGKVPDFEKYKIDRPVVFRHDLHSNEFQISENLFQAFKKYAADRYKLVPVQIDREREFIERTLRAELVTAAFGTTTARQVSNEYDNQIKKAIEALPRAKQLALESEKANAQKTHAQLNSLSLQSPSRHFVSIIFREMEKRLLKNDAILIS